MRSSVIGLGLTVAMALVGLNPLHAQDRQQSTGKGNKAETPVPPAPAHDLTGVWMRSTPKGVFQSGSTYTKEPPELTPYLQELFNQAKNSNGGKTTLQETNDPVLSKCYPPGVPRVYLHPYPFQFIQTPKALLMVFEYDHTLRWIYTDGRPLPSDPDLLWMGTSVGHWEDDHTLVVDTVGFNERTWLDRLGVPHSTQLHVVERFHRVDRDHLELQITMIDPKTLAKPWVGMMYYELRPNWEIGEVSCSGDYLDFNNFEDPNTKVAPYEKGNK